VRRARVAAVRSPHDPGLVDALRAALLHEVDGSFELAELAAPAKDGTTLVRVRAAGINYADVLVRRGRYPQMPDFPVILGTEIAGELEDGTRVMAITSGYGGYAEFATVDPAQLVPLPGHVSFSEGAAFLLAFLTAYVPLTRQVRVQSGSTVLIYAAAGGVGTAAIQVARSLGATVLAAVSSPEKRDVCRSLGAEEVWMYDEIPVDLRVDVIYDAVGGDLFAASFARLRPLGTVIAVGSAAGAWPTLEPARLVGRNVGVVGFYLGRLLRLDPGLVSRAVAELLELWRDGSLRPLVGATFALDEIEHAHELMESRKSVGKVVLVP
jgi:NADPH2:quinone reductase